MSETTDLKEQLLRFDGKRTDELQRVAARLGGQSSEIRALVSIAGSSDERLQSGATWVLKNLQERGVRFSDTQIVRLLELCSGFRQWEPMVHVLQMSQKWLIPPSAIQSWKGTLDRLRKHENKFVRAWAFNGLIVLADAVRRHRDDVRRMVHGEIAGEAASVRARVRIASAHIDWLDS